MSKSKKRVFVTGATGVIGSRAVPLLVAAGYDVTAIARTPAKAEQVRAAGATPVSVSLFDPAALRDAIAGHWAVVNLATKIPPLSQAALPGAWKENDRIRSEGSANLVDAALAAGVERFVQESITFTYPDSGDRWIDAETTEIEPTAALGAVATAEANARRFGDAVVLRFAAFYAPDSSHTQAQVATARRGVGATFGAGDAYQSTIHADDAAAAVVAALEAPAGTYDVADDEPMTKADVARALGTAVGRRPRLLGPGRAARLAGASSAALLRSQRVSNRRLKEASGWAPRFPSVREGFADVVAAMPPAPKGPLLERAVRPVLALLSLVTLQLGVWAAFLPQSFYDTFPGPRHWISPSGPYNQHFITDFGELQLALLVVLVAALVRPDRYLVRTAALAYMVFAVPHLAYHVIHLSDYDEAVDKVANIGTLVFSVALPAILVLGTATKTPAAPPARTTAVAPA